MYHKFTPTNHPSADLLPTSRLVIIAAKCSHNSSISVTFFFLHRIIDPLWWPQRLGLGAARLDTVCSFSTVVRSSAAASGGEKENWKQIQNNLFLFSWLTAFYVLRTQHSPNYSAHMLRMNDWMTQWGGHICIYLGRKASYIIRPSSIRPCRVESATPCA